MLGHKVGYNPVQFMVDNPTGTWMWNAQNKRCKWVDDYVTISEDDQSYKPVITDTEVEAFLRERKDV